LKCLERKGKEREMAKKESERLDRKQSTAPTEGGAKGNASALSRMEAEGSKLLKGVFDFLEKHVPGAPGKAREDAMKQAQKLFVEINRAFQEQAGRLQGYEKRLEATVEDVKRNVDEHVRRGLDRLDIATKTDVEALEKSVDKLRRDVNKLTKASPRKPKGATATA
jgi:polyhydroxyalkanoate synthesis regulator phasin